MTHHAPHLCFGASSAFAVSGLLEALRSPTAVAWLTFLGSVLSTLAGVVISERSRRSRADAARQQRESDAKHDALLVAALQAINAQRPQP
jgi:hypothetical protein